MIQNKFFLLLCLLHYYHNDAFYIPLSPSFFQKKHTHLLQANKSDKNDKNDNNKELDNNDLEIDTTIKSPNKIFRLGRSKDQDGKSNIWSVEPKMEVVYEEINEFNKNILTGGLIVTGMLASLPVLYTLSKYIQNIDY
jgi:hypothetical protein